MAPGIPELRQAIDELDRKILELVAQRLRLVMRVGEVKRSSGLAVYDPARERDLLERLAASAPAPLTAGMAQRIFRCIVEESRALEQRHISEPSLPAVDAAGRDTDAGPAQGGRASG